ncbi:hypothetical protein EDB80DRAFT_837645 [Ilyonectria destructans]|nr:hypothetical protein EDB80DRAFT_837645 [Ilyonectria destructans]
MGELRVQRPGIANPWHQQPANQPTNPPILHPSAQHGCVTQRRFLPTCAPSASSHLRPIQDPSSAVVRWRVVEVQPCTNPASIAASGASNASNARTPVSDTLGKRRTAAALPAGRCVGRPPPSRLALGFKGSKTPRQRPSHEYIEAPSAGGAQHAAAANRVAPPSAVLPMRYRSIFTSPPAAWDGADGEERGNRPWRYGGIQCSTTVHGPSSSFAFISGGPVINPASPVRDVRPRGAGSNEQGASQPAKAKANCRPRGTWKRANFVLAPSQRQSIIAWESVHIVAELGGELVPGQTTVGYRIIRDCGSTAYLSVSKTVSCRHVHQEECSPPGVSKGSSLTGLLASKRPRAGFFPAHRVGAKKTILIQTSLLRAGSISSSSSSSSIGSSCCSSSGVPQEPSRASGQALKGFRVGYCDAAKHLVTHILRLLSSWL